MPISEVEYFRRQNEVDRRFDYREAFVFYRGNVWYFDEGRGWDLFDCICPNLDTWVNTCHEHGGFAEVEYAVEYMRALFRDHRLELLLKERRR